MKLPDDKAERAKILVLIGFGVLGILAGLYMGVMRPVANMKKARLAEIAQMEEDLNRTRRAIKQMIADRHESLALVRELLKVSETSGYILRSRLGNFRLGAADVLDPQVSRLGIAVDPIREVGMADLPKAGWKLSENAVRCYAARLTFECSIHALIEVMHVLEESSPYLCVSGVSISAQPSQPEKHRVSLDVQWPVWADPNAVEKLSQQLLDVRPPLPGEEKGGGRTGGKPGAKKPAPPAAGPRGKETRS